MKFEKIIKFSSSVYFNEYFQIKVKNVKWSGTHHIKREDTSKIQEIIKLIIQRGGYHFGFLPL